MKKSILSLAILCCFSSALFAGETAKLVKTRAAKAAAVTPGKWHADLSKAKSYAVSKGVPLIAVWSNGDSCGHCVMFEAACNSSTFKTWMASSGCVFVFVYPGDSGGSVGGSVYNWCYKSQPLFPFVRVYWPKGGVDIRAMGDTIDGGASGATGGKKAVSWFKAKLKKFKPAATAASTPVKPYTIKFAPNGATNEMPSAATKVGAAFTLPANSLIRPDYSFAGWAKTATGSVAYKNKASVKNLTTVSNGVVTLYAKWTRTTYRTYYTGLKYTIAMSDCKGWTTSSKVAGLKWSKSSGKWTGTPTKGGTFTVKFKKGSSSKSRKIVVVKDAVIFADETSSRRIAAAGEPLTLNLSPTSSAGAPKSISVTGLPDGLAYDNASGVVSGASEKVGTFKITTTIVSAAGQKLTRTFSLEIGVPDCCIGTFNGFIGFFDDKRLDPLDLSNSGLFRLNAPSNANLSAKIVTAKGTYSFTGLGWTKNDDGTYTATLATSGGKDELVFTVKDRAAAEFGPLVSSVPSYGVSYEIYAQRSRFAQDASGEYVDDMVRQTMPRILGKWYFKAFAVDTKWQFKFATSKTADLTLSVAADGTASLAGKVGSYKVSASSAVFLFEDCVEKGYACAEFPVPITVNKAKKTLDIWLTLWFDRDNKHFNLRYEHIGGAAVEAFE